MNEMQVLAAGIEVEETEEWLVVLEDVLGQTDILQMLCKGLQI